MAKATAQDHGQKGHHPAFEEYAEAIWELTEDDLEVAQARVAERLGVSRPAVSEAIQRMADAGLVHLEGRKIGLSKQGNELATMVVRRHRLAERFLTDMLGLGWAEAHEEAGRWEHVLSDRTAAAIEKALGNPTTCPHGNPIPGADYHAPDAVSLATLDAGARFTVVRIPEVLEWAAGMLDYLEKAGLVPNAIAEVTDVAPDGARTLACENKTVALSHDVANRVLVSPT